MIDLICKGYLELSGMRVERELQNEKFLPTVGFEPRALVVVSLFLLTTFMGFIILFSVQLNYGPNTLVDRRIHGPNGNLYFDFVTHAKTKLV